MAFKLTKKEITERDECVSELQEKWAIVEEVKNRAQEDTNAAVASVNSAIDYQAAVTTAETFRNEIADRLRSEYDEKSEKWQEGDAASTANDFISEWENNELGEFATVDDIELSVDEAEHATTLEQLPTEVE
jgi:hypothetical protein